MNFLCKLVGSAEKGVFKHALKQSRVGASRIAEGIAFHSRGAATKKAGLS